VCALKSLHDLSKLSRMKITPSIGHPHTGFAGSSGKPRQSEKTTSITQRVV